MAIGIQDIINQALENREIALSSLGAAKEEQTIKKEELDFYYNYLFGDGGNNLGVINILELYNREIALGVGKITSRPALQNGLNTSKNVWIIAFNEAIRTEGDDANGFYPPENNIGSLEFKEGSNYLTTNELGTSIEFSTSVFKRIEEVLSAASVLHTKRRTSVETPGEEGQSPTISYPFEDYYNNPEAIDLENSLNNLKNSLQSYSNYLDIIKQRVEYISEEKNIFFQEAGMTSDVLSSNNDIVQIPILKNKIQDHINSLQIEINYFTGFTKSNDISGQQGYNQSVFDAKLTNGLENLFRDSSNGFEKTFNDRESVIKSIINFNNTSGNFRKWLVFWIKQVIGKFDGALISINGIENNSIPNAKNSIKNANESIQTLLGNEFDKFLITPQVFAAFYNPQFNEETGEVLSRDVGVLWSANLAANRYEIYRRDITTSSVLLTNDQWTNEDRISQYIVLNESGMMIRTDFTDKNLNPGLYVYRIKSLDTETNPKSRNRLDPDLDTSSLQSNVTGKTYTIESISENKIKLTENVTSAFGVCFILNKYYAVAKVKNDEVVLLESVPLNANQLTEIVGSVFVPE